jgi:hypothetical protein
MEKHTEVEALRLLFYSRWFYWRWPQRPKHDADDEYIVFWEFRYYSKYRLWLTDTTGQRYQNITFVRNNFMDWNPRETSSSSGSKKIYAVLYTRASLWFLSKNRQIQSATRICLSTYIHTYRHACIHSFIHSFIHLFIHSFYGSIGV